MFLNKKSKTVLRKPLKYKKMAQVENKTIKEEEIVEVVKEKEYKTEIFDQKKTTKTKKTKKIENNEE